MTARASHHDVLTRWRAGWMGTLAPSELVSLFERAVGALWCRAHLSLGELTLLAIVERVLYLSSEREPHLTTLRADTRGVDFNGLRQVAADVESTRLEESLVCLVYELLRVLGTLTGEILTPGLHAELLKVKAPSEDSGREQS